jgi:SET domain-containing protein
VHGWRAFAYQPFRFSREGLGLSIRGLVEVRPCPHGRGLFASRDIARGSVIREFRDIVLTSRPTSTPRGRYALQIGENEYWDGFSRGSPDYWSNFIDHSDDPNSVFVFDEGGTRARLEAAKPIKKGQEIFIRYDSYYPTNPRF